MIYSPVFIILSISSAKACKKVLSLCIGLFCPSDLWLVLAEDAVLYQQWQGF